MNGYLIYLVAAIVFSLWVYFCCAKDRLDTARFESVESTTTTESDSLGDIEMQCVPFQKQKCAPKCVAFQETEFNDGQAAPLEVDLCDEHMVDVLCVNAMKTRADGKFHLAASALASVLEFCPLVTERTNSREYLQFCRENAADLECLQGEFAVQCARLKDRNRELFERVAANAGRAFSVVNKIVNFALPEVYEPARHAIFEQLGNQLVAAGYCVEGRIYFAGALVSFMRERNRRQRVDDQTVDFLVDHAEKSLEAYRESRTPKRARLGPLVEIAKLGNLALFKAEFERAARPFTAIFFLRKILGDYPVVTRKCNEELYFEFFLAVKEDICRLTANFEAECWALKESSKELFGKVERNAKGNFGVAAKIIGRVLLEINESSFRTFCLNVGQCILKIGETFPELPPYFTGALIFYMQELKRE